MSAAAPILADRLSFGDRREMAKTFGNVEPYGRRGKFAVRFRHEGQSYRITSVPFGSRWFALASRELAEEILEEIRREIRKSGDVIAAISPYMGRSKLLGIERRYGEWIDVQRARMEAGQLSRKRFEELDGHLARGHLDSIRERPLLGLEYADLETLQLDLFAQGHAPGTVHHVLADFRTFLRWSARRRWIHAVPEIPVTQLDEYEPTIPSRQEQRARLDGIRPESRGYFLARGLLGIRNQEAIRAELVDYRRGPWDDEAGRWSDQISIRGKGRRFRVLPVPADLARWVREYRPALGEAGTPLFLNPKTGLPWTQASLGREWRAMERKLKLEHIKPNEALRHTFGTRSVERLMREGMSRDEAQSAIMRIMGHQSKATSDRYVKLAAETMREAIE